jgi:hypothetical protein
LSVKGWQQVIRSKEANQQQEVKIRLDVVVHKFNYSYYGGRGSRITVQGWPGQTRRPYLKRDMEEDGPTEHEPMRHLLFFLLVEPGLTQGFALAKQALYSTS